MSQQVFDQWKSYGVRLEKTMYKGDEEHTPIYFISVPRYSEMIDGNGNEMSGALLAKRVKRSLGGSASVRYVERDEHWVKSSASRDAEERRKRAVEESVNYFKNLQQKKQEENLRMFFGGIFGENLW